MLIHVVKTNESLETIASGYRVPVASIVSINELASPVQLVIGQALVIPTDNIFYTVKSGDTLWKIAQIYGTTVQLIIQNNPLANPNNIYPGQRISIPTQRHRVQAGETLWLIAQKYQVSLASLLKVNTIANANAIYPGEQLVIPPKAKPSIDVNGYIYFLGQDAIPVVSKDGDHLTYLSPFAYLIREDGNLQSIYDTPALQTAKTKKSDTNDVTYQFHLNSQRRKSCAPSPYFSSKYRPLTYEHYSNHERKRLSGIKC